MSFIQYFLLQSLLLCSEICPLENSYAEALTRNVTPFTDRVFKEVIKVKWGYNTGVQFDWTSVLIRREKDQSSLTSGLTCCLSESTQRKGHVGTPREGSCLQAKKRGPSRNWPWWSLDLGVSRTVRNLSCLNHPVRGFYCGARQTNTLPYLFVKHCVRQ